MKGKGNSVNYKYRMHDPRIGRFFAIDPLAPKYPHYTPYQFSGNRLINAIELEGLEPKTIIDKEKLTTSTILFMQAALKVTKSSLKEVSWANQSDYNKYNNSEEVSTLDYIIVENALSTHGAITIHSKQVVFRDIYKTNNAHEFLTRIVHEHIHVIQYLNNGGQIGFYYEYLNQVKSSGYRDAKYESIAYAFGDAMSEWLSSESNGLIFNLLEINREDLSEQETQYLDSYLQEQGRKFRFEKGIDIELSYLNKEKQKLEGKILKRKKRSSISRRGREASINKNLTLSRIKSQITKLNNEKESLKKEFE